MKNLPETAETKEAISEGAVQKVPLSVVILTHNSEKKIEDALKSVVWVDDIVIVDDLSTDRTLDIAKKYTDRIFRRKWELEGVQRNFAYDQAKNEYILSLDSDERVTPELARELQELVQKGFEFNGYDIPHRNYFGDFWIRHGGWYPNAKTKLFRKSKMRYEESEYHPPMFMEGKRGLLKGELIHLAIDNFSNMIGKLNHQTTFEAKKWVREKRNIKFPTLVRKMLHRSFKAYFLQSGFRDGWIGFMLALNGAFYQLLSYAKYWEAKEREAGRL
ncbi:MAG: hypothetical protein A3G33_01920 [Omnitrophica bacterium RIFCSPLOWO2_12_FULL_44_17]|uniref:Glycosyltransferase 2-like domain-containing protein n=1 Tax=Candidatus Danuiimicrobium aquiferis TaxID=1801832 RepID=A0A1G1KTC5_9BACT|nr:MAG: hypothetical protein A3B72_04030 [Omnitrophica bacterium RIFCSPHIGHO2_02_FULL_45_28]OGW89082.1 MAG: hypothetical protein A3E74_05525 [Omnitrophica bacterium RIFCSPHIGHO2_12_FULL_44_12]OGW96095.1 MAG: hypothetical protein A3G33_01920 [Omnitrophica bacterium RIFCSPLOWO2_12_FULL_44_17]OGX02394.1 MAG: hypothetical protein A3J12_05625 [Omnitrophica bacterium RIFCSPLOWO2_02_FULL_44_11]